MAGAGRRAACHAQDRRRPRRGLSYFAGRSRRQSRGGALPPRSHRAHPDHPPPRLHAGAPDRQDLRRARADPARGDPPPCGRGDPAAALAYRGEQGRGAQDHAAPSLYRPGAGHGLLTGRRTAPFARRSMTAVTIWVHTLSPPRRQNAESARCEPMTPYLSIEDLSVSYGSTRVLDHVSLGVERGEMIALLGSSGCGKTTLLRAIAGFVIPDEGTISVG